MKAWRLHKPAPAEEHSLQLAAEIPVRATTQLYALEGAPQALLDVKHSRINGEAVLLVRSGMV